MGKDDFGKKFADWASRFHEGALRKRYEKDPEKLEKELAKLEKEREETERRREQKAAEKEEVDRALQSMTLDELELLRRKTERDLEAMKESLEQKREIMNADDGLVAQLGKVFLNNPVISEAPIREKLEYLDKIELAIKSNQPKPEAPQQPPTREEERARKFAECQAQIENMRRLKADDVQRMRSNEASEEEIKRRENMWDDAMRQLEEELRKYMV